MHHRRRVHRGRERTGTPVKVNSPWNLTISGGDLYIADEAAGSMVIMNMTHRTRTSTRSGPRSESEPRPAGLAALGVGQSENGEIAVADFNNNDISFWS